MRYICQDANSIWKCSNTLKVHSWSTDIHSYNTIHCDMYSTRTLGVYEMETLKTAFVYNSVVNTCGKIFDIITGLCQNYLVRTNNRSTRIKSDLKVFSRWSVAFKASWLFIKARLRKLITHSATNKQRNEVHWQKM